MAEALDSLQISKSALFRIGINLYAGDSTLLNEFDGFPGVITLPTARFRDLQVAWKSNGIPTDFYYPADEQHTLIETVAVHGGHVRKSVSYSPKMWRLRNQEGFVPAGIPSERARKEQLYRACSAFAEAVLLRMEQLNEPGRPIDPGEFSDLATVLRDISAIEARLLPNKHLTTAAASTDDSADKGLGADTDQGNRLRN